jgi:hypothetical protein
VTTLSAPAAGATDSLPHMLRRGELDFGGAYLAVNQIAADLRACPSDCGPASIAALVQALETPAYRLQKQAYSFYRLAAQTLAAAAVHHPDPRIGAQALAAIEARLGRDHDGLQRALCEAAGCLPLATPPALSLAPPDDGRPPAERLPRVTDRWLIRQGLSLPARMRWRGRSLVGVLGPARLLIIKCLRADESPAVLAREGAWMTCLARLCRDWPERFQIPQPVRHDRGYLVRRPADAAGEAALHPGGYALAFTAATDYFAYPNAPAGPGRLAPRQILEVLERNAVLLGRLMALNICHTAPIPLFHNRSQRHRREDGGRYEWRRAGRLDRWLDSCRHPNLALSGLRDFEHLEALPHLPLKRYTGMGVHLLSLFLIAGSYFRTAAPERSGTDSAGRPVDARDLFDADLLLRMLQAIVGGYRRGYLGAGEEGPLLCDPRTAAAAMIEAMGVDRHMEEMLRIADQQQMGRTAFEAFLMRRGWTRAQAAAAPQGQADLILQTGPHLGGFNQAISVPELIRFTAVTAAECVLRRFRYERQADIGRRSAPGLEAPPGSG